MLYRLICLYSKGVAIRKADFENVPKYTGNLVVQDWIEGHTFGRAIRQARLLTTAHSVQTDMVSPLFEPVLVKVTDRQMTLCGHETGVEGGLPVHYVQAWVLKMALPE